MAPQRATRMPPPQTHVDAAEYAHPFQQEAVVEEPFAEEAIAEPMEELLEPIAEEEGQLAPKTSRPKTDVKKNKPAPVEEHDGEDDCPAAESAAEHEELAEEHEQDEPAEEHDDDIPMPKMSRRKTSSAGVWIGLLLAVLVVAAAAVGVFWFMNN